MNVGDMVNFLGSEFKTSHALDQQNINNILSKRKCFRNNNLLILDQYEIVAALYVELIAWLCWLRFIKKSAYVLEMLNLSSILPMKIWFRNKHWGCSLVSPSLYLIKLQ